MASDTAPNFFRQARQSLPRVGKRYPSRSAIARMLGVTERTVAAWETNETVPSRRLLPAIANVLNVSIEELGQAIAIQGTRLASKRGAA